MQLNETASGKGRDYLPAIVPESHGLRRANKVRPLGNARLLEHTLSLRPVRAIDLPICPVHLLSPMSFFSSFARFFG